MATRGLVGHLRLTNTPFSFMVGKLFDIVIMLLCSMFMCCKQKYQRDDWGVIVVVCHYVFTSVLFLVSQKKRACLFLMLSPVVAR